MKTQKLVNLIFCYNTMQNVFIAVSSIKKKDLAEIRSMANPPAPVKLALESVCELLNVGAADWKAIRGVIVKDNFITSIVKLETDKITYDIYIFF